MKKLLLFPVHLGSFRKGGLGYLVFLHQILFHGFDLILLQAENLVVDGLQAKIPIFSEVPHLYLDTGIFAVVVVSAIWMLTQFTYTHSCVKLRETRGLLR